jgi:carboxyl-terminal processing protease
VGAGWRRADLEKPAGTLDNAAAMFRPLVRLVLLLSALVSPVLAQDGDALTSDQAVAAFEEAWQRVHDTHFDKDFNGVDWAAVKEELRPEAAKARSREEVRDVINRMLARLGQSHFAVIPSGVLPDMDAPAEHAEGAGGLGFDVRYHDGRMLVVRVDPGGAAEAAGVKTGWALERLGSYAIGDHARKAAASGVLDDRKHGLRLWSGTYPRIAGAVGSHEQVVFLDGADERVELDLERRARDVTPHDAGMGLPTFYLEFHKRIIEKDGKRIGVIAFSNWFLPVVAGINEAMDEMRGCDGIVLDLRGNTGGAAPMTMGVAGHFFGETKRLGVIQTRDTRVNIVALPRFTNTKGEPVEPFAGPVALVVDDTSGSASEVFAGGMQSVGRVRVFGSTTAGAVLPAMTTRLPSGDTLLHAMGDFVTATGEHLEGGGVVPDVVVPLDRARLLAGEDAALEAALQWITSR